MKKQVVGVIAVFSSAVLYSLSLNVIETYCFLIIPSLFILFTNVFLFDYKTSIAGISFLWIPVVVLIHYNWFFYLLKNNLQASIFISFLLYLVLSVLLCVCFYMVYFFARLILIFLNRRVTNKILNTFFVMVAFGLSFQIAGSALMKIFDSEGSYNLLSPMIPLCGFFDQSMRYFSKNLNFYQKENLISKFECNKIKLKFLNKKREKWGLWEVGQYIFHELQNLPPGPVLVVTPESFISCPLNREREFFDFIIRGLKPQQCLMLASQFESAGRLFQAVYSITSQGVIDVYLKQHTVPCFEKMPWYFEKASQLKKIFKADQTFASDKKNTLEGFRFAGIRIVPRLCSDFFLVTSLFNLAKLRLSYKESIIVVLHVNDAWFVGYMRKLLCYIACIRAKLTGINLLYVGYSEKALV